MGSIMLVENAVDEFAVVFVIICFLSFLSSDPVLSPMAYAQLPFKLSTRVADLSVPENRVYFFDSRLLLVDCPGIKLLPVVLLA